MLPHPGYFPVVPLSKANDCRYASGALDQKGGGTGTGTAHLHDMPKMTEGRGKKE